MNVAKQLLRNLNLPAGDRTDLPTSVARFADGGHYRIEIPSVEGPAALAASASIGRRSVSNSWRGRALTLPPRRSAPPTSGSRSPANIYLHANFGGS